MKVLVVDDEPVARRRLIRMLRKIADVEIDGEAADGLEALEHVRARRPDLILLDIRMPGLDGLQLAAEGDALPPIVFTTAYDDHAVQAFEVNAVDYLMKPVKQERLEAAIARVRGRTLDPGRVEALLRQLTPREVAPITARSGATVRVFDPTAITRFRASEKYTLFQADGREFVLDESLNALEARLAPVGFLRIHRGELVGLSHVRSVRTEDGVTRVELSDGQSATVSRRQAPALKRRLGIRS